MSVRAYRQITRRKSRQIHVGNVAIGGDAPISVQTMTTTLTSDAGATIDQIRQCEEVGVDLVRVTCPDEGATAALKEITRAAKVPIIADIHFHYKRAIEAAENGAACLRINPGNIGSAERVKEVVQAAKDHGCAIRIGVNAGSLEKNLLEKYGEPCPEAMVESALRHASILDDNDFHEYKISVKASDPFLCVAAYRALAKEVDCPLHLGITEAGGLIPGTVRSAIGLGALLWDGIGDTIRVSLSDDPVQEVRVGFDILKTLGLRTRGVEIISCPTCGRKGYDVVGTVKTLEDRLKHISTPIKLAIIGCVVNGPGEARDADIGFVGGGAGKGHGKIYIDGQPAMSIQNEEILDKVVELCEERAAKIEAEKAAKAAE